MDMKLGHEWAPPRYYFYTLDGDGSPVAEPDALRWIEWFGECDRHVARDAVGEVSISTVFLGVNHNFFAEGPPILWETMIFGGKYDNYQERYSSRDEAAAGHVKAVLMVILN